MARYAGILMPITSLPSPYGVGTVGKAAYEFVDFLAAAGQKYWQILPVGPTSYGDSPYQSFSTYAGNPYLIDLDMLCEAGLLKKEEIEDIDWCYSSDYVDYEKLFNNRFKVLRIAFERFKESGNIQEFIEFEKESYNWLHNYALYMACKYHFDQKAWTEWPDDGIKFRNNDSIDYYSKLLGDDVYFWKFVQCLFYSQFKKLKNYANSKGILIFGDMPIYVAMDSADTWANPEVFWLDEELSPVCVAGCPPDYFSETGQLWGNPLYNWEYQKETGYRWWIDRVRSASSLFDVTRIDHFRAFDQFYAIPYPAENAINGSWVDGPGMDFFDAMKAELGDIPIIAEDLGLLTPSVVQLLKDTGYPGMKVLEFAFDSGEDNDYLPHNYTANSVVYTGTHDNDTIMGWYNTAKEKDSEYASEYANRREDEEFNWAIIRLAYSSVSNLAVAQMQDILGLGSEARINIPSTLGGNWVWRIKEGSTTPELAAKIRKLTKLYGRLEEK